MIVGNATVIMYADRCEDFEKLFRSTFPATAADDGVIEYRFHRSLENPCKYLIYEIYRDQAAVDAHMNSPVNLQFLKDVDPMMEIPCVCEYYEIIDDVDFYRTEKA